MSDDETFGPLLHGTARAWRLKLDERLKPMGLSQARWRTLLHLSLAGDALTQTEIAARLGEEERRVAHRAPKPAKFRRAGVHSIPRWAYVLFAVLAVLVLFRTFQRGVDTLKPAQAPARPVTVAKVVAKDVPLYLDEIGTCAAYETVLVQAQVSGVIITRNFQDGSDVKKG